MCGIAGIFSYAPGAKPVDRDELLRLRDAMSSRGPDGEGLWESGDGKVGLAHRRLAIIDLGAGGAQPMATADGRLHITFNGEIYNYQALRRELEGAGYQFRSTSDTEVLLHLYAHRGESMVHALRGMFAFAIWDNQARTMFMARDPFGIKPLYYADKDGTLRFASQVKALVAGGRVSTSPDPAGHVGFFVLGSVPEPHTMYSAISALPAGSTLTLRQEGTKRVARYFSIAEEFAAANSRPDNIPASSRAEYLRAAMQDSVKLHMVSDVPVGLFLSSGLDSSTIAALACEAEGGNLRSVTLGFAEYRGSPEDETIMARVIADRIGTRHETQWISQGVFESKLASVLEAMDQPSIDGVNTYFVSMTAAALGMKVALSGLGGDELFGGYPSFQDVPRLTRLMRPFRHARPLGRYLRQVTAPLLGQLASPKYASVGEYGGDFAGSYLLRRALYLPWEVEEVFDPSFFAQGWERLDLLRAMADSAAGLDRPRQAVAALELSWYMRNQLLRDADWAGMAHSLEIRVPLVDVELFRATARLVASGHAPSKLDMASTPARPLPPEILRRRKTGFSIPVHEWARKERAYRGPERKMRNWAHIVYRPYRSLRVLSLLTDAFGGYGGIALYNRDLLTSICRMPECREVVAIPRLIPQALEPMPERLRYETGAVAGKQKYLATLFRILRSRERYDLVVCSHINLLLPAVFAKLWLRAPLVLVIYGIDAWSAQGWLKGKLLRCVDRFVSISDVTRTRFQEWSAVEDGRFTILPNAIHTQWYGPGNRRPDLLARYGLEGKVVLMTLGRLVSSERYKGFDEVLEAMPELLRDIPNLAYLIVGGGSDRERLERKAASLGITSHVRFAGLISEEEKADHYRLADAYVMPSRGEGFGFVLLEAMACGIPAVASSVDGGREAVRDGKLGTLVDPGNLEDVKRGIRQALRAGRGKAPAGLEYFEFDQFCKRTDELVRDAVLLRAARTQKA